MMERQQNTPLLVFSDKTMAPLQYSAQFNAHEYLIDKIEITCDKSYRLLINNPKVIVGGADSLSPDG